MILLTLLMLIPLLKKKVSTIAFVGILVSAQCILILVLIGFVDGREDMYVDIAISYAILGFISSVFVAKFLGSTGNKKSRGGEKNGN